MPFKIRRGIAFMLIASLFFSLMNACVYGAKLSDPTVTSTTVSFIRVLVNLLFLIVPALVYRNLRELLGDLRPALWLRGLFGASALMLSFAAIQRIGVGESAFLHSSSGVFVALLSPVFLRQSNHALTWPAILCSLFGLGLLFHADLDAPDRVGRALALASGFLAALAYLMVARSGRSNSPRTIVFYFCLVGIVLHLGYFTQIGASWPHEREFWAWALGSGIMATGAQLYMTRAYQQAPAALLGAVGYTGPMFSLAWSIVLFGQVPDRTALIGCALILTGGIALPLLSSVRRTDSIGPSAAQ
ncbi:MAG: DMT family transporter [Methylotetracoccus sp.]|jgi:S-adenosylmethionine uptake transporter|nr:DMT family transporter [Methylotetracoccus sp.]